MELDKNADLNENEKCTINEDSKVINSTNYKLNIKEIKCIDDELKRQITFNRFFMTEESISKKIKMNLNNEKFIENSNKRQMLIPNKLKSINNFMFFTHCLLNCEKNNEEENFLKIRDFNFLIYATDEKGEVVKEIKLNSEELGFKLPEINFEYITGYKFFSNFQIIKLKKCIMIFLVVYNYICIIRLNSNEFQFSSQQNLGSQSNEKEDEQNEKYEKIDNAKEKPLYEIVFKKEFTESNLLLYLGSELTGHFHKFFVIMRPTQKFIVFTCAASNRKGFFDIKLEEKNLEPLLKLTNEENTLQLACSKFIVSNSPEIILYEKNSNKIFMISKQNMGMIRSLQDCHNELSNIKNFFILIDNSNDDKNLYLVTDELTNENNLTIKIFRLKNYSQNKFTDYLKNGKKQKNNSKSKKNSSSKNESKNKKLNIKNDNKVVTPFITYESVECEKIQSISIQIENTEEGIGSYNFTLIDDNNFALFFYNYDEIFIFSLKNNKKSNQSNFYVDNICELNFQELFAYMFDYQMKSDRILALTLYQEEEFLKYEIDLNKGDIVSELKLNTPINLSLKENSVIESNMNSNDNKDVEIKISEVILEKEAIQGKVENETVKTKKVKLNSPVKKVELVSNNLNKSGSNKGNISSSSIKNEATPLHTSPENQEREGDNKFSLNDLKKSISDNIITGFEVKLDNMINSKLNYFAENLNIKLADVFSFMKKQTDELEEIRKKNSENMTNLTNLILKGQEKLKSPQNILQTPANNSMINNLSQGNMNPQQIYNKNLNMMNAYSQQHIKPNPLLMQMNMNMAMGGGMRPNWGYPFHVYPSEYIVNSVNNLKNQNNAMHKNVINQTNFGNMQNPVNNLNQNNYLYHNNNNLRLNKDSMITNTNNINNMKMFNNLTVGLSHPMTNNACEIPTDNKYKEDEIILENLEKKLSEIKNEEANLIDGNLTLDFNNENNKNAVNYSSDISSGNLESDVKTEKNELLKICKEENNMLNDALENHITKEIKFDSNNNLNILNAMNTMLFHRQLMTPGVENSKMKSKIFSNNRLGNKHINAIEVNLNGGSSAKPKKKRYKKKEKKTI